MDHSAGGVQDRASPPLFYSIPHYLVGYSVGGVFGKGVAAARLFYSTLFYSILFGGAHAACATRDARRACESSLTQGPMPQYFDERDAVHEAGEDALVPAPLPSASSSS